VSPPTNYKARSNFITKVSSGRGTYVVKEGDADEWHGEPAYDWETRELEEARGVVDEGRDGAHGVDSVEAEECAEGEVGQVFGMGRVEFGIVVDGWRLGGRGLVRGQYCCRIRC